MGNVIGKKDGEQARAIKVQNAPLFIQSFRLSAALVSRALQLGFQCVRCMCRVFCRPHRKESVKLAETTEWAHSSL